VAAARDIGVRSEVDDGIVLRHGGDEPGGFLYVAPHHAESRILKMMGVVPLPSGRKVIVNRDGCDFSITEQPVAEMAADKSGASDNEESLRFHSSLHFADRECIQAEPERRLKAA